MSMIQARFKVIEVRQVEGAERVALSPVWDVLDKKEPNMSWSAGSPQGRMEITVTQHSAFGKFKVGQTYLMDINPWSK